MSWPEKLDIISSFIRGVGWVFLPLLALPIVRIFLGQIAFLRDLSRHIITTIDGFNHRLGETVKWLLPILVLVVAFIVFADAIFGRAWTKLYESATYMHAIIIMVGSAAALLAGQHVRVDIFHSQMNAHKKARTDLCGFYLLLMPVCLVLLWNSQDYVRLAWRSFEGSPEADGLRGLFLLKTTISVFCLTMLAQGLAISLRAVNVLRDEPEPERPAGIDPLFPDAEMSDGR